MSLGDNPPRELVEFLIDEDPTATEDDHHRHLDELLDSFTIVELAAWAFDYSGFWLRRKQRIPRGRPRFSSWGFLTGRAFGKTFACAAYIVDQVLAGRATRIALMAQSKEKTLDVMVHGVSGLIAMSPSWHKPVYIGGDGQLPRLVWPCGAQAFVYSPNKNQEVRGPEHDAAWLSELVAWSPAKRDEAWSNIEHGLRLGDAVMVWDSTPKRKDPLIRERLASADAHPGVHVVIRGHSSENVDNLNRQRLKELMAKLAGTQRGKEELGGEYLEDDEGALWSQSWIDTARRELPAKLDRRIISIDPAISTGKATDETGYVELALAGSQVFVCSDQTGSYAWSVWGEKAVRRYVRAGLDCIVIERNKGGEACAANIVAEANQFNHEEAERARELGHRAPRPWKVRLLTEKRGERIATRHEIGTIYVKEVNSTRSKARRAEPVATLYKNGGVSHDTSADLLRLETTLTTWEPEDGRSPDDMDALVHGVWELYDLEPLERLEFAESFQGIEKVSAVLQRRTPAREVRGVNQIADLLGKTEWRSTL